ncbi:hypothetical protein J7M00_07145 [bacterium]|nr:hypothetical protein [bacterium]
MSRATVLFGLLFLVGSLFAQGTPHTIAGSAQNSDFSAIPPGCGEFIAYPYPSADDTVTRDSDGCGFAGSNWWVEISSFGLDDGDTVAIRLENTCNGETLLVLVEVDLSIPTQNIGVVTLVPGFGVITVLYPNGGETFEFGDNINIQWTASTSIVDVNIDYSTDGGGSWNSIADGVSAAAGTYLWVAPSVESDQYLVRVENSDDPATFDISDNFFEVVPAPSLDLTFPVGGEHFIVGDTIEIAWTATGVTTIDIYFSANLGIDWTLIDSNYATGAAGTYDFIAPDTVSNQCLIRIWDHDDHGIMDVCSAFEIDTFVPPDTTPPSDITDLDVDSVTFTDVLLSWTLTGDDWLVGIPSQIDIRYSTVVITDLNWGLCTPVGGLPAVDTSGTHQTVWVNGLTSGETYYFAMKIADEVPNWSGLSNVVSVTLPTPPDTTPPGAFVLEVSDTGCDEATISWLAPGDDGNVGTADRYEFRYADYELTETNFATGILVDDVPDPALAGTEQNFVLTGLDYSTHYWVAGYAYDEEENPSPFAVVDFITTFCADTTPPAMINILDCEDFRPGGVQISWLAPGDDGYVGYASSYEVRYDTVLFHEDDLDETTVYPLAMIPNAPGETEYAWIDGLEPARSYYFAVFAYDNVGNRSPLGALIYCTTMGVLSPVSDVDTYEDAPDFMLVDMADVFLPAGLNLFAEGGDGLDLYYLPGEEDSSQLWVHLQENWWGSTYVIIYAEHEGYLIADTVAIDVVSVNDAPYFTCGIPDSVAIPGIDYTYIFTGADADEDSFWFFLSEGPSGMNLFADGNLSWSPPPTEGHYDVTVGITDGQDTTYLGFPVRVYKLTDSVFAPRNLEAHSDFVGSIPLTWDIPLAIELGFPVHLVGYRVYRGDDPDEEPTMIGTSDVNTYNDGLVSCGVTKYYRVKAVYDVPDFVSAYSNTDAGMCNSESERIYSAWSSEPVIVDGYDDDAAWDLATTLQIPYGYTLGFVNTASRLYGYIQFSDFAADDEEFSLWFDDDNSGFWDVMPSDEGRIFFRYGDSVRAYFQPVASIGGVAVPGTPVEFSEATSVWRVDGISAYLEFSIPLGDDAHFGVLPGDSSAVMLLCENSTGPIFRWMATSEELVPVSYGRMIVGMPGGVPSIMVSPASYEFTLEQGLETQAIVNVQNLGEGTGYFSISGLPDWIDASPTSEFLFPATTQELTLTVHADMEPGDYVGYVNIYTTDPENPVQQVEVILHITPLEPENHLEISLPSASYGSAGSLVNIPVSVGELYDNDITSLNFTIYSDPDVAMPTGASAGAVLPGTWTVDVSSIGEDHITVHAHGFEPLPLSGEIVNIQYQIDGDAMDGAITQLAFSDVSVNSGFPYPYTSDGILLVGDQITPYWSAMIVLVLPDESRADSAYFGVHPLATNDYDPVVDMLDPPTFPGEGNIYFLSDNGYQLARDLRYYDDTLMVFPLVIDDDGMLVWDVNRVWSGCFVGDTLDMKEVSYLYVSAGDTVYIYYHNLSPFQFTIHLKSGWNMISIPFDADSFVLGDVIPDALPPAYYYDPLSSSYVPVPVLYPGRGYWVLMLGDHSYDLTGEPLLNYEIELPAGWSMIGAPSQTVYWDEQTTVPSDAMLPGALFGYDATASAYFISNTLQPGYGYWVMSLENCILRTSAIYSPAGASGD